MSIMFMDGFDHYGNVNKITDGVYAQADRIALFANAGPGGFGTAIGVEGEGVSNTTLRKVLNGARDLVGVGFRLFFPALPSRNKFAKVLAFHDGGNLPRLTLYVESTGAIGVYLNDGELTYQTEPVITANSWQFLEVRCGFEPEKITLSIGVNSITVYDNDNFSSNVGGVLCQQILMLTCSRSNESPWKMRDLYIWDGEGTLNNTGMQGDRQVVTSFVDSDGPLQDWIPSTGSVGYAMIDEVPPVDTDYVAANGSGDMSNYGFTDIDTDITNISAVQVVGRMKKSDAGVGSFKFGMNSDGTLGEGAEKGLTTEWTYYWSVFETDPDTTLKWTPFGVNNALVQLDRIT